MNQNANTIGIFTENVPSMYCPHCDAELDVSEFMVFEDIQCPSCGDTIKVPGRLGDFVLIDELGRGAMGCVYLAQDESLGRLVALKVLRKEFGEDPKMLETVQREAQAMASLNHINICQVYSFGRADKQPYFVMELLTGERLDEMIAEGGTVSEIRALEIALDVAKGLEAAEQAGLTHGDIKPANILTSEKGVAKVVDFGLAKFMDPDAEVEVWGTPYYIAPEKARKKGEDSRSDQFSLGGTLFHALAGHPPFDADNPTKVVIASLKEETPLLKEHNPSVTDKTSAVIRRMMDKNPNRRYPTYASLLSDLDLALNEARAVEEQRRLEEARAREAAEKTIPLFVWIVLGTLVTILFVGGLTFWQMQRQKRLAVSVQYEGPDREVHRPLIKAEVRNMTQAATALAKRDLKEAEKRLRNASRRIPERHSAMGWYRFFTAGMYLYAQEVDTARRYLRDVVETEDMIFDGGRVPREDPRRLAALALGDVDEGDLEKDLRRGEAYYRHLAQLARGYRSILSDGYNPDARRYFSRFAEYRIQGLEWPYVLMPLVPDLHLTRPNIAVHNFLEDGDASGQMPENKAEGGSPSSDKEKAKAEEGSKTPVAGARQLDALSFQLSPVNRSGKVAGDGKDPEILGVLDGRGVWVNEKEVLTRAMGLQPLSSAQYTLGMILELPEVKTDESLPLLGIGDYPDGEAPKGIVLEWAGRRQGAALRFRTGNGERETQSEWLTSRALSAGDVVLLGMSWNGEDREIEVFVNERSVGGLQVPVSDLPSALRHALVVFAGAPAENETFQFPSAFSEVHRRFVLDHRPSGKKIYDEYADRIRRWNR